MSGRGSRPVRRGWCGTSRGRCTVVDLAYAEPVGRPVPPDRVVLKTHHGDKGLTAWAAMNALWDRPEVWRGSCTWPSRWGSCPGT